MSDEEKEPHPKLRMQALCNKAVDSVRDQFPKGTALVLVAATTGPVDNISAFSSTLTPLSASALLSWITTELLCGMTRGEYDTSNTPEIKKEETPK